MKNNFLVGTIISLFHALHKLISQKSIAVIGSLKFLSSCCAVKDGVEARRL